MENSLFIDNLKRAFSESILQIDEEADMLTLVVASDVIKPFLQTLKSQYGYAFLTDLCGIHYPEQALELGVVYHLHDLVENRRMRVKTFVSKTFPQIDSVVSVFPSANWMERETYDFYGIEFVGHPNLKRILNVEYMDYHPMRKEYPLEDATREDKDDRFFGR